MGLLDGYIMAGFASISSRLLMIKPNLPNPGDLVKVTRALDACYDKDKKLEPIIGTFILYLGMFPSAGFDEYYTHELRFLCNGTKAYLRCGSDLQNIYKAWPSLGLEIQ